MFTAKQWIGIILACFIFYGAGMATVTQQPAAAPVPTPVVKTVTKTVPDTKTAAKLAALTDVDNKLLLDSAQMGGILSDALTICTNGINDPFTLASQLPTIDAKNAQAQQVNSDVTQLIAQRKQILSQ